MIRHIRNYPKTLDIGENIWTIRFIRFWPHEDFAENVVGYCDPSDHTIYILLGQSPRERFKTLVHEVIHAFEFEYDIKIPHWLVEALEEPVTAFLEANQLVA